LDVAVHEWEDGLKFSSDAQYLTDFNNGMMLIAGRSRGNLGARFGVLVPFQNS
jgi:hypothetical protein